MTSTPTPNDLARMNGELLNVGSSAIAMSSALRLPDQIESTRLPTLTLRPRAVVNYDSMRGRKLLTLMTNGRTKAIRIKIPTIMPTILRARFMEDLHCLQWDNSPCAKWLK